MITIKGSITDVNKGEIFDTVKIRSFIMVGQEAKQIISTIKAGAIPDEFTTGDSVTIVIERDATLYDKGTNEVKPGISATITNKTGRKIKELAEKED